MAHIGLPQPFSLTRFQRNQYLPRGYRPYCALVLSHVSGEFGVSEALNQQIDSLKAIYGSELDPQGRAFVSLADTHCRLGDLDEALVVIQEGLGIHPDFASAHMVAGLVHRARRDSDGAMTAFERVLELDSENSLAQAAIAELIDDQRAQAYRDKMAAKKLAEQSAEASMEEGRPVVPIDSLAGTPAETSSGGPEMVLDDDRPGVPIESLSPTAPTAPAATAPSASDVVLDDDRPVVAIESLAPDALAEIDAVASAHEVIPDETGPVVGIQSLAPEAPREAAPAVVEATPDAPSAPADDGIERPLVSSASLAPDGISEPDDGSLMGGLAPLGEEIYTETLAELYASQGAADKAIETYRRMLEFDPDNDGFRRRIEELESVAFNSDVVPALDMSSGHAAAAPDERPTESLAPDEDPGDGTSDDPFPWVSQL
jgi:tetratricopeptide (TPR) repeat protein